jgi:hypothetical protein
MMSLKVSPLKSPGEKIPVHLFQPLLPMTMLLVGSIQPPLPLPR